MSHACLVLIKIFVFLFAVCGCKITKDTETSTASGVYQAKNRWSSPSSIPVCWTNGDEIGNDPELSVAALEIEDNVKMEFDRTNRIRFQWKKKCDPKNDARQTSIKIKLCKEPPAGVISAASLIGMTKANSSTWFSTAFPGQCPGIAGKGGKHNMFLTARNAQIKYDAIHEFGHSLGLLHEHERADRGDYKCHFYSSQLKKSPTIKNGTPSLDKNSVMNYCSEQDFFSVGDIETLNKAYPGAQVPKHAYSRGSCFEKCIEVFEHNDYNLKKNGRVWKFFCSEETNESAWNDKISSVKIPTDMVVKACIHSENDEKFASDEQRCRILSGDVHFVDEEWNDKISYLKLIRPLCL